MGRKIEMKKIEDHKKSLVTFSKRRSSLIKKAQQTAITCDVDVAFLAFSSSGRISKYCNPPRMEDLLYRYVNLPVEKRLSHVKNVQDKMKKLQELGNTRSEDEILPYLNAQTENLEFEIKMKQIEVQLAEADLRDFELSPGQQEVSLNQFSWCERNLRRSIEKLKEKKKETLATEAERQLLYNGNGNSLLFARSNPPNGQRQMQFESWRNNPFMSLSVPKGRFDEMVGKGKGIEVTDAYGPSATTTVRLGAPTAPGFFFHNLSQKNHPLWKQVLVPSQQDESKSLFGNFTGESSNLITRDYLSKLSTFHESSKHVTNTSVGAGNYWGMSFQQNQPTIVLNNVGMEANEKGNANNKKGNNHTYNETILSSAPSVQATPPASRAPIRLYDFFPTKPPGGKCTEDSED